MTEVVVTRRGQTTIPKDLRAQFKIEEGTKLEALAMADGILLKKKTSTLDLAGTGRASLEDALKILYRIRDED
ncbi:MAG TPA: AbrB/MazE/SpoVT family DNA-binding domain-containing protein [Conexivisphaerales archaeon]|nr:AbrB/MazE/SpoVT family DNA-binding domain-containing protein [Conexivisphaerales archaeon]